MYHRLITSVMAIEEHLGCGSSLLTSGFIRDFAGAFLGSWHKIFKTLHCYLDRMIAMKPIVMKSTRHLMMANGNSFQDSGYVISFKLYGSVSRKIVCHCHLPHPLIVLILSLPVAFILILQSLVQDVHVIGQHLILFARMFMGRSFPWSTKQYHGG